MGKGSTPRPIPDPQKFRDNWDQIFGKKEKATECPKCGAEDYESVKVKPGHGDSSKVYCLCTRCGEEFDGKTIWD